MLSRLRGGRSGLARKVMNAQNQQNQQNPIFGASIIPSFSLSSPSLFDNSGDDNQKNSQLLQQQQNQYRLYHSTSKREIVPVIAAAGVVFVIGRYSWKALSRMDEEWDDYQWQLQQYERQRLKQENAANTPTTIGVDFGSLYLKLSKLASNNQPELIPTAQGDRYRFTGILMTDNDDDGIITGKPALDKFFYQPSMMMDDGDDEEDDSVDESVILPYRELQKSSHDEVAKLVQKIFVPAVGEAMERLAPSAGGGDNNKNQSNGTIRTVLTLPPTFYNQHGETIFQNYHDEKHHTITVPDPVATIWGAQNLKLIPEPESKEESASTSILVMDVGGLSTTISLVKQDKVVSSTTLDDIGGENFVQQLVNKVFQDIGDVNLSKDPMSLELVNQNVRGSALELINKDSTTVHIPYLFMGRKPNEPHFETTISRNLMDQIVVDYWKKNTIPKLVEKDALSSSLPPPTNASSLFTSAITKVLEDSEDTLPNDIKHILIVGGGSRHGLFERACREGIETLIGPTSTGGGKMVLPDPAVRAELPSLGASALLPNFDYSYDKGLERA